jgi:hypothetical protein
MSGHSQFPFAVVGEIVDKIFTNGLSYSDVTFLVVEASPSFTPPIPFTRHSRMNYCILAPDLFATAQSLAASRDVLTVQPP